MNTDPEPSPPPPPLQIDVLQAEVQALKTLVLSSPTSPLGELPSAGVKTPFRKGHSRNKSTSSAILGTQPDPSATQPIVRECREVELYLTADNNTVNTLNVSVLLTCVGGRAGGQSAVQRFQGVEGGADAGPGLLLLGESLPWGHLPLPHLQQERGTDTCGEISLKVVWLQENSTGLPSHC